MWYAVCMKNKVSSTKTSTVDSRMKEGPTIMSAQELTVAGLGMFVLHALIVRLAAMLVPGWVVFGTASLTPFMAQLIVTVVFTLVVVSSMPLIETVLSRLQRTLPVWGWITLYTVFNAVVIWAMARFAEMFGMGIVSFWVAIGAGFLSSVLQGMVIGIVLHLYRKSS